MESKSLCISTNDGSNADLGRRCTFEAKRAYSLGWRPDHAPEHIVEVADAEVELILNQIGTTTGKITKR